MTCGVVSQGTVLSLASRGTLKDHKMSKKLKIIQINPQNSKRFIDENINIGLLERLWINGGRIQGLATNSCEIFYSNIHDRSRVASMLRWNIKYSVNWNGQLVIVSAYSADTLARPLQEKVQELITPSWRSTNNNAQAAYLFKYLSAANI